MTPKPVHDRIKPQSTVFRRLRNLGVVGGRRSSEEQKAQGCSHRKGIPATSRSDPGEREAAGPSGHILLPQTRVTESKRADVGSLKTCTLVPPESKRKQGVPEGPERAALAKHSGQALSDPGLVCKHVAVGHQKLLLRKCRGAQLAPASFDSEN